MEAFLIVGISISGPSRQAGFVAVLCALYIDMIKLPVLESGKIRQIASPNQRIPFTLTPSSLQCRHNQRHGSWGGGGGAKNIYIWWRHHVFRHPPPPPPPPPGNMHTVSWISYHMSSKLYNAITLIARFMGPTWGPSGADRTQVGPMLAHELCYLGTYLLPNFNGCTVEDWEWINNFITQFMMNAILYPCWDQNWAKPCL